MKKQFLYIVLEAAVVKRLERTGWQGLGGVIRRVLRNIVS